MEYADGGIFGPVRIGRPRPVLPLEVITPHIDGVGNTPPFSAIMAMKEGRLARRRLAIIPPGPDGNRGQPPAA